MIVRIAASLVGCLLASGVLAAPTLKADARVNRDVVTLGDLVDGLDDAVAAKALFGAPRLGDTGTIQASRIVEAARSLGIAEVETGGLTQTIVVRQARRVGTAEIEAALRQTLAQRQSLDASGLGFSYDGALPVFAFPPEVSGPLKVDDIAYDARARRVSANLSVAAPDGTHRRVLRVTAAVVETLPVAVLTRALNRGDAVGVGDIAIERRPRETVTPDGLGEAAPLVGQVARRAIGPGVPLRSVDLAKPDIVQRGEIVTVVYEAAGLTLTTRGKTGDSGAMGDLVTVQNLQSKRMLQATVSGPGRVTVTAPSIPGPLASNDK